MSRYKRYHLTTPEGVPLSRYLLDGDNGRAGDPVVYDEREALEAMTALMEQGVLCRRFELVPEEDEGGPA